MDKKDECIGIGFWVDGFGTVDMYCYIDDDVRLDEDMKIYVKSKAMQTMARLFKVIENPELIEEEKE